MNFPCDILADVANMSRGNRACRCYEDVSNLFATSRACRARGIWRTTRHTNKRAALHRSRPPADQSGKRVASWTGKSPDMPNTRDVLVASSRGCRACRACRRRCYDETAPVEFQLYAVVDSLLMDGQAHANCCMSLTTHHHSSSADRLRSQTLDLRRK